MPAEEPRTERFTQTSPLVPLTEKELQRKQERSRQYKELHGRRRRS